MMRCMVMLLMVPCFAMAQGQAGLYRLMAGAVTAESGPPYENMVGWYTFDSDLLTPRYGPTPEGYTNGIGATAVWDASTASMKGVFSGTQYTGRAGIRWPDGSDIDPDIGDVYTITIWVKLGGTYVRFFGDSYIGGPGTTFEANSLIYGTRYSCWDAAKGIGPTGGWDFLCFRCNDATGTLKYTVNTTTKTVSYTASSGINAWLYLTTYGRNNTTYMDDLRIFREYISDEKMNSIRLEGRQ